MYTKILGYHNQNSLNRIKLVQPEVILLSEYHCNTQELFYITDRVYRIDDVETSHIAQKHVPDEMPGPYVQVLRTVKRITDTYISDSGYTGHIFRPKGSKNPSKYYNLYRNLNISDESFCPE